MQDLLDHLKRDLQMHVQFKKQFMQDQVQAAYADGMKFFDYYDLVLALGEGMIGEPRPEWLDRMTPQACYSNCWELCLDSENLTYYEGYGLKKGLIIPVSHAWVVNEEGRVIDPTWTEPETAVYWGIPIDRNVLVEASTRTGMSAVLESDWMADNWFLREGWKTLTRAGILELV